jgi:hypothetical protein
MIRRVRENALFLKDAGAGLQLLSSQIIFAEYLPLRHATEPGKQKGAAHSRKLLNK